MAQRRVDVGPRWPRQSLAILVAIGAAASMPWWIGDYGLSFMTSLLLWIALTESWVLLSGYAGYISLGHAAFVGIGAYVLALTWGNFPFLICLGLGAGAGGLVAAVAGIPCLRVRGPYFVILTLSVAEFLKYAVINIEARVGSFGRLLLGAPDKQTIFWLALAVAASSFALAFYVRYSRLGVGLRAIRENEQAAEATGVPAAKLKALAYVLSAIIPAMVGALMVARTGYFEPASIFSSQISLTIIAMCVAGGSDDPWGPLLGVLLVTVLSEVLRDRSPELYQIILGGLLVFFVMRAPQGLLGWLRRQKFQLPRLRRAREMSL
jgi:branched-chain amino acid transport system permease protein